MDLKTLCVIILCSIPGLCKAQTSARDIWMMNERLRQQSKTLQKVDQPPPVRVVAETRPPSNPYVVPVTNNQPPNGDVQGRVVYIKHPSTPQQVSYPVAQAPTVQVSAPRLVYTKSAPLPQPGTPNIAPPSNTRVVYAQSPPLLQAPSPNPANPPNTRVVYVQNPPVSEPKIPATVQGIYAQKPLIVPPQSQPYVQDSFAQNVQVVPPQNPSYIQGTYSQNAPIVPPPNSPYNQGTYVQKLPVVPPQNPPNTRIVYAQNPPPTQAQSPSQVSPNLVHSPSPQVIYSPNPPPIVAQQPQVIAPNPPVIYVQNPPVVYAQSQPVVLASNPQTAPNPTIVYVQHPQVVTPGPLNISKPQPNAQPLPTSNPPPKQPKIPYVQPPQTSNGMVPPRPRLLNQPLSAPTTTKNPISPGNAFAASSSGSPYSLLMNSSLPRVTGLPAYCRMDLQLRGVRCIVPNGNTLQYEQLKSWALNSGRDQRVVITCMSGGTVSTPWPMKAMNIVHLSIQNCVIIDFFKNIGTPSIIPDKMIALEFYNSTVNMKITELANLVRRFKQARLPYNKISDCGQQTLKKYVFKDINFDFLSTRLSYAQYAKVERFMDGFIKMSKQQTCNYPNLIYLDESGNQISSLYHFQLLTANAMFAKLKTYLSKGIGLQKIPNEISKFPKHFPCLEYLDLSDNFITNANFNFEFRGECLTPPNGPMYINLRNNQITTLPTTQIEFFLDNRVIIDLQGNPIQCLIQTNTLRQYAMDMAIAYPKYATVLKATPCYNANETTHQNLPTQPVSGLSGTPQGMQPPMHPGLPPAGMPIPLEMLMPLSLGISGVHPHPIGLSNSPLAQLAG